jgi:DNA-binding transcriptional ArsR family regulator
MIIKQSIDQRFLRRAAGIFKALADENRFGLLLMLDQDCECARSCEVASPQAQRTLSDAGRQLGISTPTVSHHLKQLQRAGFITCIRSGRRVQCATNLEPLQEILAALGIRQSSRRGAQ